MCQETWLSVEIHWLEFLKLIRNGARHDFEIDRNARDKNMAAVATANCAVGRGGGGGSGGLWFE
jgi:hypothetical protein